MCRFFFDFLSNLLKANTMYTVSLCSHEEKLWISEFSKLMTFLKNPKAYPSSNSLIGVLYLNDITFTTWCVILEWWYKNENIYRDFLTIFKQQNHTWNTMWCGEIIGWNLIYNLIYLLNRQCITYPPTHPPINFKFFFFR